MKLCFRCGKKGNQSWNICADNNKTRYVCKSCDIQLNTLVLIFMGFRNWRSKINKYMKLTKEE